jgi:DNA-binding transcriptional regulator YdaS (Cro superfamily)
MDVEHAVPTSGKTALHLAAAGGHAEVVDVLLSAAANVAARDAAFGSTPLHVAAPQGHAAVVGKLILAGADVYVTDNYRQTPLMLAAQRGHLEAVELLVANGVNSQQALVVAARKAAGKGHMAIWAFLARKVQGIYPQAVSQCVAGMDAVAPTQAMAVAWEGEVDRHEVMLQAARVERAEGEAARQQAQQLFLQSALILKQLECSRSDR